MLHRTPDSTGPLASLATPSISGLPLDLSANHRPDERILERRLVVGPEANLLTIDAHYGRDERFLWVNLQRYYSRVPHAALLSVNLEARYELHSPSARARHAISRACRTPHFRHENDRAFITPSSGNQ